jgi:hypothetical protein
MAEDNQLLVRCAHCEHNFEAQHFGQQKCPICRVDLWLDPVPGIDLKEPKSLAWEEPENTADQDLDDSSVTREKTESELSESSIEELGHACEWETGKSNPFVRFFETARQVLFDPGFFVGLTSKNFRAAMLFGWILCTFEFLVGSLYQLLQVDPQVPSKLPMLEMDPQQFFVIQLIGSPLFGFFKLWLYTGLVHLGVWMISSENRGFKATFKATAYGFVPLLGIVIPWVGPLIGTLWSLSIHVTAVAQIHKMKIGKAALAVLIPWVFMMTVVATSLAG